MQPVFRAPRFFAAALLALAISGSSAAARTGRLDPSSVRLIRSAVSTHRKLALARPAVQLEKGGVLSDPVAASKRYGDSWTCRSSTRMLAQQLGQRRVGLTVDSVGKNAFFWGNQGWVDYHYFGVDNPARPRVLLDPTASSNFRKDVAPGGMLRGMLVAAGGKLRTPDAAERVTRRIARGGVNGLLVLADPAEIAVYREALEQASQLRARLQRNRETTAR